MSIPELLRVAALLIGAYLIGSIPFSYLVARARGVDLRKVGSGNVGGANVWRACGFGPFVVAAALDILKGYLPTLAGLWLFPGQPTVVLVVGIAAILGHTFPIFLSFKGGKAVATSTGVLLAITPLLVPFGIGAWALAFAITRNVSHSARLTGVSIPRSAPARATAAYRNSPSERGLPCARPSCNDGGFPPRPPAILRRSTGLSTIAGMYRIAPASSRTG